MHLVFLVVEAERVHGDVDAEADRLLALQLAARGDLELPGAQRIAREGADQIVARIEHRDAPAQFQPFEIGRRSHPAGRSVEQVEGLVDHVLARNPGEFRAGHDARNQQTRRLIEGAAARAARVVDEEKPAVAQVAAQLGDFGVGRRGKAALRREHREGEAVEIRIGKRERLDHRRRLDAGAARNLPRQPREPVGPRIPPPAVPNLRELEARLLAECARARGGEEERKPEDLSSGKHGETQE